MSNNKRLTWIGPARLDSFKACAKALGREFDVPHSRSLDALAQSVGWLSYRELQYYPDLSELGIRLVARSTQEVYELWCKQVTTSYALLDRSRLAAFDRLPKLFHYLRVPSPDRPSDARVCRQEDGGAPPAVRDPMLQAADWRDAEFRRWIGCIVERGTSMRRGAGDDRDDAGRDGLKRLDEALG